MKTQTELWLWSVFIGLHALAPAQAFYNPSTGRWLNRDPMHERGGTALYGFVNQNPVANTDVLGLWGGDHRNLTVRSFDDATQFLGQKLTSRCRRKLLSTLKTANKGQDTGLAFNALERHYNRPYVQIESEIARDVARSGWQLAFANYLQYESDTFGQNLSTKPEMCKEAAQALGRMSHTWQDFFAHATHSTRRFDESPTPFPATPDCPGEYWPSSYGGHLGQRPFPEHPLEGEPLAGGGPEYHNRLVGAISFVAEKYKIYLKQWVTVCKCKCESM